MRTYSTFACFAFIVCCAYLVALPSPMKAQGSAGKQTVKITPGDQYQAGAVFRFFFGDHWRDLWTSEIEVEVLDLDTYAGGLKPVRKGGGFQTKSLRFLGADGVQYKFRSLDKDPKAVLPKLLQRTVVADVIQDQISTAHPLAALVVAPIANAVGILQAEPILVVLPDSPKLGEFQEVFGGLLGTLEVHPDEGDDGEAGFAGSEKIISTPNLFERLEKDNDEQVDQAEFLKARLTDVFLGDWDRHTDQWRWARFEKNGEERWTPIARDRDQAFARYDGLFPWIAAKAVRQLEGFSEVYPDMEYLTWSGRHLDRRYLSSLDRQTWDSITKHVHSRLTDDLIQEAVQRMPQEWFALEGERLISDLKTRRDNLPRVSEEYYFQMKEVVDIWLSNKKEYVEIERRDDRFVDITVYKRDKKTGGKKGEPLQQRTISCDETYELRIYLLGGNDYVEVSGDVNSSITVRIIGGQGDDEIVDNSHVSGYALGLIPFIPDAETRTYVYDKGSTDIKEGSGTCHITRQPPEPADWAAKYEPQTRDRGHDWRFGPVMGYTSDDGLVFGGGPILYEYGFRNDPWVYRQELGLGIAPFVGRGLIDYTMDLYHVIPNTRLFFNVRASQLEHLNYYGISNGTEFYNEGLEDNDFYRVKQNQILVRSVLEFPMDQTFRYGLHATVKNVDHSDPDDADSTLLLNGLRDTSGAFLVLPQPAGSGETAILSVGALISYDSRDVAAAATKGIYGHLEFSYMPRAFNNRETFSTLKGEFRAYLTANVLSDATLALRLGGKRVFGNFADIPFFEGAYLGGPDNLRGFTQERFLGDASVYGAAELRFYLFPVSLLVPGRFGLMASVDTGRVFNTDDDGPETTKWHVAPGGGFWLSLVENAFTLSASVHPTDELLGLYIQGGFGF